MGRCHKNAESVLKQGKQFDLKAENPKDFTQDHTLTMAFANRSVVLPPLSSSVQPGMAVGVAEVDDPSSTM